VVFEFEFGKGSKVVYSGKEGRVGYVQLAWVANYMDK